MLPGDFIALRLSGDINTTVPGLSEGIFYDFEKESLSKELIEYFAFGVDIIPDTVPVFGIQARISKMAARDLGLAAGTLITYRAGDQPNNGLSLNVLNPGEMAVTAGTSGVVYAVSDYLIADKTSRVNTFAHVNHLPQNRRLGILLCINGTGILYAWARKNLNMTSYNEMNTLAAMSPVGSKGLCILPFGNGAERILYNQNIGAHISNLHFNDHNHSDVLRAMVEGIVYAFKYGIDIMKEMGFSPSVMRAGNANLLQSDVFSMTLATLSEATIELYDTDGAEGAARGAGIGMAYYDFETAFFGLDLIKRIDPHEENAQKIFEGFQHWKNNLDNIINHAN